MKRVLFGVVFVAGFGLIGLSGMPLDLSQYQGENPVIVIFARQVDEPRAFSFNLALSTDWNRIEARKIATVDVGPGRYDLDSVARQLGIQERDFAIVVLNLDGTIIYRTDDPQALRHILMLIDQELSVDHTSLSSKDPRFSITLPGHLVDHPALS